MKYKLKRPVRKNLLTYGGILIFGIVMAIMEYLSEEFVLGGFIIILLSGGFIINELIRSKDSAIAFDENGFRIGETQYSYRSIDEIASRRERRVTYVKIIVGGETVYKFDTSYENANEFVKQLTLNGVDHNLFS
ncbi:MAG: hypothetical protein IJW86_05595 [Clostridia bacterium]|nr:hypothetical protein [Clostridia bacterium]